jgi:arginine decarboxylase
VDGIVRNMKHAPDELRSVSRMLPDKYFCNFSLFQSLPDAWAIDQVFPVIPIDRLSERPTRFATLQDMTCDSDGKLTNFISSQGIAHSLPVHKLKHGQHYYLGIFLVGAYQEILGDMHNLFGDTNAVHINVFKDHYEIDQVIDGETVAEVLDYVEFNPKQLVRNVETWVSESIRSGKITSEEGNEFVRNFRSGLYGYTYLEK